MIKDNPRGVGYLLGEPGPVDPVVQEYRNKIKELQRKPIDNTEDIFSQLPFVDKVNLGVSNTGATPKITPPIPKRKGPTKGQIYRGAMKHFARPKLTEQEKEFWGAWNNSNKMLKYVKKHTDAYAGDDEPVTGTPNKRPYYINRNGELLDANKAEQWQHVPKEERFNDRIQKQDKISVSDNKVKGTYSPRNEVANRKPKILSTPMGQVKVIRNTNNEPGKMNKEITNKEGYVR